MQDGDHTKGIIAGLIVFAGIIAAGVYLVIKDAPAPSADTTDQQAVISGGTQATFLCDGGKRIDAIFGDRLVQLDLSDGREITIEQAISASGARYANENESFVFWNKGDTALIEENGTATYSNCATESAS